MNYEHSYKKGSKVAWQGRLGEIAEINRDDAIAYVRFAQEDRIYEIRIKELMPIVEHHERLANQSLVAIDAKKWAKAERRANVCEEILQSQEEKSNCIALGAVKLCVCERSMWRIFHRYMESRKVSALVDGNPGPAIGTRMTHVSVEAAIHEGIEEIFLRRERPTESAVIEYVAMLCRERELKEPAPGTVRKRIAAIHPEYVAYRRDGRKKATERFEPVPGHITAERPLQTVQIDHTLADVMLVSNDAARTVIGRPWLTLAIDVATRCVVGFHVTFDSPSSISVAVCVLSILMPKRSLLEAIGLGNHAIDWPCSGKPEGFLTDNAKDFHADALKRGCAEYRIDLQFRPVGKPRWGGVIERLIGTFMGRLRLLPGATQRDVRAKGDQDIEAASCMTLAAFRQWLVLEITTQYHQKVHSALDMPPLDAWYRSTIAADQKSIALLEKEAIDLFADFLPCKLKPIRRIGIELHGMTYWNDQLRPYAEDGHKYAVCYDPRDITRVFFLNPKSGVSVIPSTKKVPAISINEWQKMRRAKRVLGLHPDRIEARDRGLRTMQTIVATNAKDQKKARRLEQKRVEREQNVAMTSRQIGSEVKVATVEPKRLDFNRVPRPYPMLRIKP